MKKLKFAALLLAGFVLSTSSFAQSNMSHKKGKMKMKNEKTVMVGGAQMYPSKNIVENAVNSKDHTTLVAAVKLQAL